MRNLTDLELQGAIAQLDQATYNHDQWHRGLLRVLVARLPPDDPDLVPDAHLRCRFGQWYEGSAAGFLRELPAFVALGEAHRQMHQSATELLRRVSDDLPVSAAALDQFNNLLDRMRLELGSLRGDLSDTAQNRDPLTGARNRASLLSDLREQHALVRRGVQACALVMIDLDHFKAINDRHGHAAGDAVLSRVARCLQELVRPRSRRGRALTQIPRRSRLRMYARATAATSAGWASGRRRVSRRAGRKLRAGTRRLTVRALLSLVP